MAESARAKANRYARGEFTNRELKILLGGMLADQAIDIATFGRLSKLKGKAFVRVVLPIVRKVGITTARAAPGAAMRLAGSAIGATRFVVMRHPYVAAAVVTYEVIKHRDEIAQLASEGWEVIQDTGAAMVPGIRTEVERLMTAGPRPSPSRVPPAFLQAKKRPSKFNKAISAGMKAVKRSKFLGKPGKFTNSKTAFSRVTKTVARLRKGAKVARKGVTGIIARAVRRYI